MIAPVFFLDRDNSVLCEDCAADSEEDFIERFRPESGPHPNPSPIHCDECGTVIPDTNGRTDIWEE